MKRYLIQVSAGILAGVVLAALGGCGSANSEAPAFLGTHPVGWEEPLKHGMQYVLTPEQCTECHGKDLLGGISKQSCTPCHHHAAPAGFPDWDTAHGTMAKRAPGDMTGYAVCRSCHGENYQGSVLSKNSAGTPVGCISTGGCHNMQIGGPSTIVHPPHSGGWNDTTNFIGSTHTTTDPANGETCLPCHTKVKSHVWLTANGWVTYGNLSAAVAPGDAGNSCFNNTMCHTRNLPSPLPVLP